MKKETYNAECLSYLLKYNDILTKKENCLPFQILFKTQKVVQLDVQKAVISDHFVHTNEMKTTTCTGFLANYYTVKTIEIAYKRVSTQTDLKKNLFICKCKFLLNEWLRLRQINPSFF